MKEYKAIIVERTGQIAKIFLNRPEVHNALNSLMIKELHEALDSFTDDDTRLILLSNIGKSFCAGADLNWMKDIIKFSYEQNLEDSLKLADLLYAIFTHPKPIITIAKGSAFGGGVGIFAATDIVFATENSKFAFTEVKIGIVPSVISPYIIARTGINKANELFLTGEAISAVEAQKFGLVNYVANDEEIESLAIKKAETIMKNSPYALKKAKELIFNNIKLNFNDLKNYTVELISHLRISEEAQEGMNAFLEKRKPYWS